MKRIFKTDKLVRDNLPERLKHKNIDGIYKTVHGEEYLRYLKLKIIEEANELAETEDIETTKDGLADLLELVYTLCNVSKCTLADIEQMRVKKREEQGGYEQGVCCQGFSLDADNPAITHYTQYPKRYEEIK